MLNSIDQMIANPDMGEFMEANLQSSLPVEEVKMDPHFSLGEFLVQNHMKITSRDGKPEEKKAPTIHFNRDGTFESHHENHGTWSVEDNKTLKMSYESICNTNYK
jgi:hypothetical protein